MIDFTRLVLLLLLLSTSDEGCKWRGIKPKSVKYEKKSFRSDVIDCTVLVDMKFF